MNPDNLIIIINSLITHAPNLAWSSFSLESLSGNSINHHATPTVVNVVRRQTYLQMAGLRKWS